MRWNLGLAGLATSWGLIAVLAAAVVARRRAAGVPAARARGATLALSALVLRRADAAPAGRPPRRADRARGRAGRSLVAVLRGGQARLGRARRAHVLLRPRSSSPCWRRSSCPSGSRTSPSARSCPAGIGIALVALAGEAAAGPSAGSRRLPDRLGADVRGAADPLQAAAPLGRRAADRRLLGLPRRRARARAGALLRRPCAPARRRRVGGGAAARRRLHRALDARSTRCSCGT